MNYLTILAAVVSVIALVVSYLGYTDSHRVAKQTLDITLRPALLVEGYIDWGDIKFTKHQDNTISGNFIALSSLLNIAQNITGSITINGKKYTLMFGNNASAGIQITNGTTTQINRFVKEWGWIPPNSTLYTMFDPTQGTMSAESNNIYLQFKDIAGNPYHLLVDSSYSQTISNGN